MKLFTTFFLSLSTLFSFTTNAQKTSTNPLLKRAASLSIANLDQTIQLSKRVLDDSENSPKDYLYACSILGDAYIDKKDLDSAIYFYKKGLEKSIIEKDTIQRIRFYSKRGYGYFYKYSNKEALADFYNGKRFYDHFSKEAQKTRKLNLEYARLLNNIASIYIRYVQLDSSIVYLTQSIKVMEANKASKHLTAIGKYNLGEIYSKLKDYEKSIDLQKQSLLDGIDSKDSLIISSCYINIGFAQNKQKDTINALINFKKSVAISQEANLVRLKGVAYKNIGSLFLTQKKYYLSKRYYLKALNAFNKTDASKAGIFLELGSLYKITKDYDSAVYYNKRAINAAKKNKTQDKESTAYLRLSELYQTKQQFPLAITYLKQHIVLKDSILNKDKQELIETLKTAYETEQKQKEIAYLKKLNESESQKSEAVQGRQRVFIVAIILAFLLLLVLFLSYISKRKKEKKLAAIKLYNQELKTKEYQTDIEHKTKQLTTHALNMLQKNTLLSEIRNRVKEMSVKADTVVNTECKSIIKDINFSQKTDKDWDLFKKYFENVNHDFYTNLKQINPNLSTNDCRLAALVSLNLNIKETASLLSISPNSVKIARHRLRKKLHIKTGDDLFQYLTSL